MIFNKKRTYINWDEYKEKVDFIDTLEWQQSVRRNNVEMI